MIIHMNVCIHKNKYVYTQIEILINSSVCTNKNDSENN